ncbi:hypothetical protein GTX14_25370 [Streptomyces sp. SID4944]|nr:hypothetical protein [Streptomyces sp. SID4944]
MAGRIPEDEVLGLLRAHDEVEKATGLIAQLFHDPAHRTAVWISDRNELELRLYPSFTQEINFEEWMRPGDEGAGARTRGATRRAWRPQNGF